MKKFLVLSIVIPAGLMIWYSVGLIEALLPDR
jgi:hypothetical protein